MKKLSFILIQCILYTFLSANNPVAEIIKIEGDANIIPFKTDKIPSIIIPGRSIYNKDILRSSLNSNITIKMKNNNLTINITGLSEAKLECDADNNCTIMLNYGNLFLKCSKIKNNTNYLLANNSKITLDNNEIWITSSLKNKIYAINGNVNISYEKINTILTIGKMFLLNEDGNPIVKNITKRSLPKKIWYRLINNQNPSNKNSPFTVMNIFSKDSIASSGFNKNNIKTKPFNFTFIIGASNIENSQYGNFSIIPFYDSKKLNLSYNLSLYIALSDTSKNINLLSNLSSIIAPININYRLLKNNLNLKIGKIDQLTFGYGMLLKKYTNTISYPIKQDGGIFIDYKSNSENFSLNLFSSSISELINAESLIGIYSSFIIKPINKLRIGLGSVHDINQFASVSDSIWPKENQNTRTISGYQFDLTYKIKSGRLNDIYLFSELATLNYSKNLIYIRNSSNNTNSSDGFERKNSFSILGPGILINLGHYRNIKFAFAYSSALNITPFFSQTYNLDRIHYVPSNIIENIDTTFAYNKIEKWNDMIKSNYINPDSSAYYLSKDVYSLLDPTSNVYNKWGLSAEYKYKFRNLYEYSLDFNFLREIEAIKPIIYYTIGINIHIKEGAIKRLTKLKLYFNQYFTSHPFNLITYNENTILGMQLGVKLLKKSSILFYSHNVFYDNNFDGQINSNLTMGISVINKF